MVVSGVRCMFLLLAIVCNSTNAARQRNKQKTQTSIRMDPSSEQVLVRQLLRDYRAIGTDARPVRSVNQTLQVRVGIQLLRILDLDTKNQILTTVVRERYTWRDRMLQWNPREFQGVDHVRLPADSVWTPDIVLYNAVDEVSRPYLDREVVVADSHGHVLYIRLAVMKSTCSIDARHFPFDNQSCHLNFASLTYDGFKLDLEFFDDHQAVDLSEFTPSAEWSVARRPGKKTMKYYACCVEPFPEVVFTIPMERQPFFYMLTLVVPGLLLCVLTAVVFCIPPGTADKANMGMAVFMSLLLLMLISVQLLPSGAMAYSHFGILLYKNMFAIFASVVSTSIVLNLYAKGKKGTSVPKIIRLVFIEVLARMMCVRCTFSKCSKKRYQKEHMPNDAMPLMPDDTYHHRDNNHMNDPRVIHYLRNVDTSVQRLVKSTGEMIECLRSQDKSMNSASDWFVVAQVIDRLLFLVYIAFIISTLVNFFL